LKLVELVGGMVGREREGRDSSVDELREVGFERRELEMDGK